MATNVTLEKKHQIDSDCHKQNTYSPKKNRADTAIFSVRYEIAETAMNTPWDHRRKTSKRMLDPQTISRISFNSCSSLSGDADVEAQAPSSILSIAIVFLVFFFSLSHSHCWKMLILASFSLATHWIYCLFVHTVCMCEFSVDGWTFINWSKRKTHHTTDNFGHTQNNRNK